MHTRLSLVKSQVRGNAAILWALSQESLQPHEKLVLFRIAEAGAGQPYDPDEETLAAECHMTVEELYDVLERLSDADLLIANEQGWVLGPNA